MIRIALPIIIALLLWPNLLLAQNKTVSIIDYGAVSGGTKLNSISIQNAIDAVHEAGGGKVVIPSGTFLTGSLVLKSNVELHFEKYGILLGSTDINDYFAINKTAATYNWPSLLLAKDAQHIKITGKGTIDGQGKELALKIDSLFYVGKLDSQLYQLKEKRPKAHARPQLIQFVECSNVELNQVELKDASSWVQTYDMCKNVRIHRIKVNSVAYWNNDGIDIIDCQNVEISNSEIHASDDGICVKSYERSGVPQPYCDSIRITDCMVRSSASAVKLGTSSYGGFRNVRIENILVFDTYRSAVAIEAWETGLVENIYVDNIRAFNTGNAIFVRLGQREIYKDRPMGGLKNVYISNVKAVVPYVQPDIAYNLRGPALPFFHNTFPASITGIPEFPVENVTLENIKIIYPGYGDAAYANLPTWRLESVPEKIGEYPEFSMFGELPAWGLYVRHVNGLNLSNVLLKVKHNDYRPPIVFDDVQNLSHEDIGFKGKLMNSDIIYHNTKRP